MIAGHFGLGLVAKSRATDMPVWAFALATQWLDVIFVPLYAAGVETLAPVAGSHGGYGEVIIHADYTHSLVGAAALSLLFGALSAVRWGRRGAALLAAVAFSHWLLDLVVHRADMPILPGAVGTLPRVGFGLWETPAASVVVEVTLVVLGTLLYWRAAVRHMAGRAHQGRAHTAAGVALLSGLVTLTLNALGY